MTKLFLRKRAAILAALSIVLVLSPISPLPAQQQPYGGPDSSFEQPQASFSTAELTNLVAPVALYPDPLLGQILVVSTYPQELFEAGEWLQQNGNLPPGQLMEAAKAQNWDPSVQALVGFPNVMALLTGNMQWTSDLGRAFLAQPSDVMNAIQYLRAQARANGQLANTPELSVNTQFQNGQSAIEIEPANPQMMYVPAYNPYAVWGAPAEGSYPSLAYQGTSFGSLFSAAINLASLFTGFSGLMGPSGWGWGLGWLAHTLFVNNSFFSNFGFRAVSGLAGLVPWVHSGGGQSGGGYGWGNGGGSAGFNGGRGMGFNGGRRMFTGAPAGRSFAPRGPAFNGSFQARNWTANRGDWRGFENRTPAYQADGRFGQQSWSGGREAQPYNRFAPGAYPARSAESRPPSRAWGSGTDWRSRPSADRGFSNFKNDRNRWPSHAVGRSSDFSEARPKSGHGFLPWHSSASWKAPKAPRSGRFKAPRSEHFKAPHFSAPHFKSHDGGHSSRGHGGGKSHRR